MRQVSFTLLCFLSCKGRTGKYERNARSLCIIYVFSLNDVLLTLLIQSLRASKATAFSETTYWLPQTTGLPLNFKYCYRKGHLDNIGLCAMLR